MTMNSVTPQDRLAVAIGFREFVAMIAALMALNALAIDAMLPALPAIGRALAIDTENHRQLIITIYLFGFGGAQLVYGPLSDRFGRKPVLMVSLAFYILFSAAAALAGSFTMLLAARFMQGAAAASSRVLAVSIVRDRFAGRQMARVMSLSVIVFMAVPILAPSVGQLVLLIAPWRWIFGVLALFGVTVFIWVGLRLPETLHPEYRLPITYRGLTNAARKVVTDRMSVGYTLATTALLGALYGFIGSVQQIFFDVFDEPTLFPIFFALMAGSMIVAAFTNARIVGRLGTRRVSHCAIFGYLAVASLHLLVAWMGYETIWTFAVLQAAMMACFSLASSNFSAMAMESLGEVAGTASSVQGFVTIVLGSFLGFLVGQSFDGTTVPVTAGYVTLGALTILIVLVTERGQLFRPQHPIMEPATEIRGS